VTSAGRSKKFFFALSALSLVFSSAGYSQVYEITEQELQQIDANMDTVTQEAQQWKARAELLEQESQRWRERAEQWEKQANSWQERALSMSEEQESLETAREELNKQLQAQAQLYAKSESEKKALIKYGLPAAAVCIAGAFFAGYFAGK
jgi:hypothetical protein